MKVSPSVSHPPWHPCCPQLVRVSRQDMVVVRERYKYHVQNLRHGTRIKLECCDWCVWNPEICSSDSWNSKIRGKCHARVAWVASVFWVIFWAGKWNKKIYWTEIARYSNTIRCCIYTYTYAYSISMIFTHSYYKYDGFSPFICRLQDDLQARAGLSFGTPLHKHADCSSIVESPNSFRTEAAPLSARPGILRIIISRWLYGCFQK